MAPELTKSADRGQRALDKHYAKLQEAYPEVFEAYDERIARETVSTPGNIDELRGSLRPEALLRRRIVYLEEGHVSEFVLPPDVLNLITLEEIAALESQGIVVDGIDGKDHRRGGIYIKDLAFSVRDKLDQALEGKLLQRGEVERTRFETLKAVRLTSLRGVTALVTDPSAPGIPEDISGLPSIPVDSLAVAVYQDGKWSKTHVFPHGRWLDQGVDNTTSQYGQAGFEGMKAVDLNDFLDEVEIGVKDGQVNIFRPEENARRFAKTCVRLGIPPVSVNQFIEAVKVAVEANRRFIPKKGEGSLYIRPYVVGLTGGTGAKVAKTYRFAVQVSPFGKYLKPGKTEAVEENKYPGSFVKAIVCPRGEAGRDKAIANYAIMFAEKEKAKAEGFTDILLMEKDEYGVFATECGTSNFFIVKKYLPDEEPDSKYDFELSTTTLEQNILPGITRKSLLELLRDPKIQQRLGKKVYLNDCDRISDVDIASADGAISTGTAAGISNIASITMDRATYNFRDEETQEFIKSLQKLLQDAIAGKLEGYEHWVMKV